VLDQPEPRLLEWIEARAMLAKSAASMDWTVIVSAKGDRISNLPRDACVN
jgi:hypothetical protein